MDKRYQVFVSSTFEDLQEERKEVMQALLELDCIPAGMELFPASNDDQWSLIKKVINDSDYYLLIVGGRYGSLNEKGISYTQMEFEYALETGKPIISFLPKEPESIIAKKCEKGEEGKKKLEEFKKMAQRKMVRYWTNTQDLGSIVSRSIIKLIKDFPAVGWVKADNITDENSMKEILKLQRENEALKAELLRASTNAPKGSENLSQGDDEFEIHFTFKAEDAKSMYTCKSSLAFSWNEIFAYIAPSFIDECKEYQFELLINKLLRDKKDELKEQSSFTEMKKLYDFEISNEDFNLIKVQFKALGLIRHSERKRGVNQSTDYWTLTDYGDHVMTQLLAIRKNTKEDNLDI